MKIWKKTSSLLLALLVAAGMLSGCGSDSSSGTELQAETAAESGETGSSAEASEASDSEGTGTGGTFVYAVAAGPTSFDLHNEITENNAFAIDKVFESLMSFDQNGEIINWLADSYTISDDNLVYTFVLRDGLKFSDGTDVTADDVVFSLNRHIEVGGSLPLEADVASVEAQDEKTVVVTLNEAYAPFLSELANFSNGIIPKDFGGKTEEEFFQNPVGTGPFVVESWDPAGGDVTFVKNEYYWQEGKPYLDKLVYKVISDSNQVLNQLNAGEINASKEIAFANVDSVANGANTKVETSGGWSIQELFFNTLDEHFSDVHVRRAIAMVIDKDALIQALTFGYATKSNTILPTAIKYNTNDTIDALQYDLDAAKEELAQSSYPDGFDTSIIINSANDTAVQIAQVLQDSAAKIGINIEVKSEETATFRNDFLNYNFSMMINSATADFPDAEQMLLDKLQQ
jgi:peptide/nickel transport system substrate-binding protein